MVWPDGLRLAPLTPKGNKSAIDTLALLELMAAALQQAPCVLKFRDVK
ncbi:MAG: hypothetical protein HRT35_01635 [Algicola sp.]|nr:hypothetical protein [Algicola sp.]